MALQWLCVLSLSLRYWVKLQGEALPFLQPASSSFRYKHEIVLEKPETTKVDLKYHLKTRREQGWARGRKGKGPVVAIRGLFVFLPPRRETARADITAECLEEHETLLVTLCTRYGKA